MTTHWRLDEADVARLGVVAGRLALLLRSGDVVALSGPLGAGKTTFARALIAGLGGGTEVPSPTFALMQRYELPHLTLSHFDFYRLAPHELDELGLDDALSEGAVLIEWPERAAAWLPEDRLDIAIAETARPDARRIVMTGHGRWGERLERLKALSDFLDRTPYAETEARYLLGDASTRSYARLPLPARPAILMNAPRQPDGPPIRGGKPYSAYVHLAEDVTPFVAIAGALKAAGLSVPEIYDFDLGRGFIVLEDLGAGVYGGEVRRGRPLAELWGPAVDVLVALAGSEPPAHLPVAGHAPYTLPRFDAEAMLIEASLLIDWFWPALHGKPAPAEAVQEFEALWRPLLAEAAEVDSGWVMRDYHSPNLMWLPEREGVKRVGILDFQDALRGPLAYDLVSLLQDARLDVPEPLERELLARYCSARGAGSKPFSRDSFVSLYALLGAQRNSKILGIF
ncbi:MAG: tRNA (adenosine(37)-N6)-threonylcarbamoyltransferase complex ATPase subunit type 1 TsaE, partial [Methyloceanibacter sp.]